MALRPSDSPDVKEGEHREDRSPSMDEKVDLKNDPLGVLHKIPDPDEGLSEEEKHKLVRYTPEATNSLLIPSGQEGHAEGRPLLDSLAGPPIPAFVLGPNKYRKREDRRTSGGPQHVKQSGKLLHTFLNLGLADLKKYNNTLTVFFITYSLVEPITQVLLKRFRPSIFIPTIMVLWAICKPRPPPTKKFLNLINS